MTIVLEFKNIVALILGKYNNFKEDTEEALAIMVDGVYEHLWKGDSWYGPGIC